MDFDVIEMLNEKDAIELYDDTIHAGEFVSTCSCRFSMLYPDGQIIQYNGAPITGGCNFVFSYNVVYLQDCVSFCFNLDAGEASSAANFCYLTAWARNDGLKCELQYPNPWWVGTCHCWKYSSEIPIESSEFAPNGEIECGHHGMWQEN